MWRNDELEYSVSEQGDRIAKFNIDSNMLPVVSVDTYSTFTGGHVVECDMQHIAETFDMDTDDLDVLWGDQRETLRELSESAIDVIHGQLYGDVIELGKVNGVYSPRYYNFQTDSFNTDITVNVSQLIDWIKRKHRNVIPALEAYADEHFKSYDGFLSFVTGALYDERRLGTLIWLGTHMYLADALSWGEYLMDMTEAEVHAYTGNLEIVATEHGLDENGTCTRCGQLIEDDRYCHSNNWREVAK